MLKWLVKSVLIFVVFVPAAALFPLAAVALSRTPDGAQFLFWTGPWSCCLWVLIYSTLSAVPWRQGAEAVRQHRRDHGGLLVTSAKATIWMFFGLFASYAAEFLLVWIERERSLAWLPLATYSPIAFCWFWRRLHE